MTQTAYENLRKCQRQLDQDGIEVGVSRQALDEVLTAYAAASGPAPILLAIADALDCYWNAAIGAAHDRGFDAMSTATITVQGIGAVATRLREIAGGPPVAQSVAQDQIEQIKAFLVKGGHAIPDDQIGATVVVNLDRLTNGPRESKIGPWRIWYDPPPIGTRAMDWHYQHEDCDGPDSPAWMTGSCASREACVEEIISFYDEKLAEMAIASIKTSEVIRYVYHVMSAYQRGEDDMNPIGAKAITDRIEASGLHAETDHE